MSGRSASPGRAMGSRVDEREIPKSQMELVLEMLRSLDAKESGKEITLPGGRRTPSSKCRT